MGKCPLNLIALYVVLCWVVNLPVPPPRWSYGYIWEGPFLWGVIAF